MTDQYAAALRRLCVVMGTYYTSHIARHLFRLALDLKLLASSEKPSVHDFDPSRSTLLVKKVLYGGASDDAADALWSRTTDWALALPTLRWLEVGDAQHNRRQKSSQSSGSTTGGPARGTAIPATAAAPTGAS